MKNYKFLLKPIFFIFNLVFATWLVIYIERIEPSDLGRYKRLFEHKDSRPESVPQYDKYYLKKLADDYKSGVLDSEAFDIQLEKFIDESRKKKVADKK
ncbi:MAG: hypothetical protein K0Q95_1036 [Bacteroidota bacterium]|jgi:hypothetical protein|nr:hypothetical protein [Bacteroidota bacterium]